MTQQNDQVQNEIQSDVEELQQEVESLSDVTAETEQLSELDIIRQRLDTLTAVDVDGAARRASAQDRRHWQSQLDKQVTGVRTHTESQVDALRQELEDLRSVAYQNLDPEEQQKMEMRAMNRRLEAAENAQRNPIQETPQQGTEQVTPAQTEFLSRASMIANQSGVQGVAEDFQRMAQGQTPQNAAIWEGLNQEMNPDQWLGAFEANIRHYKQNTTAQAPAQAAPQSTPQQQQPTPPLAMGGGQRTRTADEIIDAHNQGTEVSRDELTRAYKEKGVS
jgi:hypothetical protein